MREIGISVRSLEEAAYNREYGGRNWNAGEVIELVLRRSVHQVAANTRRDGHELKERSHRPNGTFAPFRWLVLVMAHELAHCKHMNHGPSFKKTNAIFLKTVLASLAAGFTGVGFWGKGNTIEGEIYKPLVDGDLPEFTCGGQSRKRSAPARKRKPRKENGAAKVGLSTGRQTRIQRKPGGRVTREGAFVGEGVQLNAADSTFRYILTSVLSVVRAILTFPYAQKTSWIEKGNRESTGCDRTTNGRGETSEACAATEASDTAQSHEKNCCRSCWCESWSAGQGEASCCHHPRRFER